MNINSGIFVDSMDSVNAIIEENTGERAAQIPIALDSLNKRYYVTDKGKVFFVK